MMRYGLYIVTEEGLSKGLDHTEIASRALEGGADVIQLRDKAMDGRRFMEHALKIRNLTKKAGALFIVNDRVDIALAAKADGVHLGQDDMPINEVRPICPKGFIIGITAHNVEEAVEAEALSADYIGLSPIFQTGSKNDAGPACGVDMVRKVKARVHIPVVAIGGIGPSNARDVLKAGADGLAVISAVVGQDDIAGAARRLRSIISEFRIEKK